MGKTGCWRSATIKALFFLIKPWIAYSSWSGSFYYTIYTKLLLCQFKFFIILVQAHIHDNIPLPVVDLSSTILRRLFLPSVLVESAGSETSTDCGAPWARMASQTGESLRHARLSRILSSICNTGGEMYCGTGEDVRWDQASKNL